MEAFIAAMQKANVVCGPVQNQGWGLLTQVRLPGGGHLGVYQPRHGRPKSVVLKAAKKKAAGRKAPRRSTASKKRPTRPAKKRARR